LEGSLRYKLFESCVRFRCNHEVLSACALLPPFILAALYTLGICLVDFQFFVNGMFLGSDHVATYVEEGYFLSGANVNVSGWLWAWCSNM